MLPHYRYTHKHTHAISHSLSIGLPPSSWSSWVIEQFELIHPNLSSPSGVPETKSIECEQQSVLKTFLKNTHFNLKKIIRMTCQFISTVTKNIVFTARYWSLATVIRYRLWRKMENSQGIVGVCQVIAMQLLRYSECFLAHCYAAARVFWVVHTGKVKRSYLSLNILIPRYGSCEIFFTEESTYCNTVTVNLISRYFTLYLLLYSWSF